MAPLLFLSHKMPPVLVNIALLLGNCVAAILVAGSGLDLLAEGYEEDAIYAWRIRLRMEAVVGLLAAAVMGIAALQYWRGRSAARYVVLSCQFYFLVRALVELVTVVMQSGIGSLSFAQVQWLVPWAALLALNYFAASTSSPASLHTPRRSPPRFVGRIFLGIHWAWALLLVWSEWRPLFYDHESQFHVSIRANMAVLTGVAVVAAVAAQLYWRGSIGARYVMLACLFYFALGWLGEVVAFCMSLGVERIGWSILEFPLFFWTWLVLSYAWFRPAARTPVLTPP